MHFKSSLKTWHLQRESPGSFSLTVRAAVSQHISPPSSALQHRWHQIYCLKSSFTLMLQLPGQGKAAALPLFFCLSLATKKLPVSPTDSQHPALYSKPREKGRYAPLSHLQIEQRRVDFTLGNSRKLSADYLVSRNNNVPTRELSFPLSLMMAISEKNPQTFFFFSQTQYLFLFHAVSFGDFCWQK